MCPWLTDGIMGRAINTGGFSIQDNNVVDIVHENAWRWPNTWMHVLYLKSHDGLFKDFTVRDIWHAICDHETEVAWHSFVWSTYGIPRHSIHVWLIMRKRLKTQDRLRQWDVGSDADLNLLRCPLCKLQPDTHEHLFFECYFAPNVWKGVLQTAELPDVPPVWSDSMDCIIHMAIKNNVTSIVGRLIVAATTYYVCQARRNQRPNGKKARKAEEVTYTSICTNDVINLFNIMMNASNGHYILTVTYIGIDGHVNLKALYKLVLSLPYNTYK
ncbi:reverse transcriptase domain, Reverse transcriptase zinc-binding domain protein [Artemisia annua]|uniref:Reverse transcriptase domain, Reverse transcriptase zinc-binding domain protein n=1 Tax=Artemisia annua TaxID=35608 RepID=A0A2U1M2D1_ARTAN|nr:reverse transcriptase domain, Reverse transcriptase zinc-binding domain protein [Artemisia annua]